VSRWICYDGPVANSSDGRRRIANRLRLCLYQNQRRRISHGWTTRTILLRLHGCPVGSGKRSKGHTDSCSTTGGPESHHGTGSAPSKASVISRTGRSLTLRSRGRPNGMAHWPSSAGPAAHFALAVQCAMPLGSPLTQTLGGTKAHLGYPRSSRSAGGSPSRRYVGMPGTKEEPSPSCVFLHRSSARQVKNCHDLCYRGQAPCFRRRSHKTSVVRRRWVQSGQAPPKPQKTKSAFGLQIPGQLRFVAGLASVRHLCAA
jgi:hypothetical protein